MRRYEVYSSKPYKPFLWLMKKRILLSHHRIRPFACTFYKQPKSGQALATPPLCCARPFENSACTPCNFNRIFSPTKTNRSLRVSLRRVQATVRKGSPGEPPRLLLQPSAQVKHRGRKSVVS
jgi:hypothetical protein